MNKIEWYCPIYEKTIPEVICYETCMETTECLKPNNIIIVRKTFKEIQLICKLCDKHNIWE